MSLYNDDELVAPAWIDQEFLANVLSNYERNGEVEIVKFDMSPASMKGDHYASIMFRCKVEYRLANKSPSTLEKSLIIKTLPIEESKKREFLTETSLFETEIQMYSETLPKIEKILADSGEPTKLSAGIVYHSLEPHKVIIMEDLCQAGYDTLRGRFLTEDEVKLVYAKLAKLHAVTYMLGHSEDHESVTKYREGYMTISMPMMKDMLKSGYENFLKLLSSYDEFHIYLEKMKAMQDELEPACKDLFRAYTLNQEQQGEDIFVLNHGDFHIRNMMFKFGRANQIEDVMMVDYQISCYAPSCIDLMYSQFLMMSTELRLKRHDFTQYYFTEFIRILKKLKYEGTLPKYSQFQMSSLKYRHFTIYALSILLPLVLGFLSKTADELKDTDATKLPENPDLNAHFYFAPNYVEELRNLMPLLLNEGYLD